MEKEEYEKIIDNSKTGFEKITDKGLVNFNSSDVKDGDRVVAESNRRLKKSIDAFSVKTSNNYEGLVTMLTRLNASVNRFNKESSKQTDKVINLTKFIIVLTIIMTIGLAIQIGLSLAPLFTQG